MNIETRRAKTRTYMLQLQEGNIRGNAMEVLYCISRFPKINLREICQETHMPIQSASSALSTLMDGGLVREVGQIKVGDSFFSQLEFEPDQTEQDRLAIDRRNEKVEQWLKKGLEEYGDLFPPKLIESLENFNGKA